MSPPTLRFNSTKRNAACTNVAPSRSYLRHVTELRAHQRFHSPETDAALPAAADHAAVKATPAPCPWTSSFAGAQLVERNWNTCRIEQLAGGLEADLIEQLLERRTLRLQTPIQCAMVHRQQPSYFIARRALGEKQDSQSTAQPETTLRSSLAWACASRIRSCSGSAPTSP